jgi:hypothetical protein
LVLVDGKIWLACSVCDLELHLFSISGKSLFRAQYTLSNLAFSIKTVPIGGLVIFALIVVFAVVIGWWVLNLLQRLVNNAFPMGVFAIGQGTKRHNDKDKMRYAVFVGFINIAAGIVLWLFLG